MPINIKSANWAIKAEAAQVREHTTLEMVPKTVNVLRQA